VAECLASNKPFDFGDDPDLGIFYRCGKGGSCKNIAALAEVWVSECFESGSILSVESNQNVESKTKNVESKTENVKSIIGLLLQEISYFEP